MKKLDCIHSNDCQSNCNNCIYYKSNKKEIRTNLVMNFVNDFMGYKNEPKNQDEIRNIARQILTMEEFRFFEYEINGKGI